MLWKMYSSVLTGTGLYPKLMIMLRIRSIALSEEEKYVTLSLDGMTLTKGLTYQKHSDTVIPYVDTTFGQQDYACADKEVVLMIHILMLCWKQINGYVICYHNLSASNLCNLISSATEGVTKTGFVVKAIVINQVASV